MVGREALRFVQGPKEDVSVEEKSISTHSLYSLNSSSGASKSSAIQILPLSAPSKEGFLDVVVGGTRRATTLPWRVTAISSPPSARLTSSENLALASATDMFMAAILMTII